LHRAALLAAHGLTAADSAILCALHYGLCHPPEDMPGTADGPDYSLTEPVSEEQCRAALANCLAKGWAQVIDQQARDRITAELCAEGVFGPIYGLPWVGGVDFTPAGARLWQHLLAQIHGGSLHVFAFTDVVHARTSHYFRSRAAALIAAAALRDWGSVVSISDALPIGPWRVQWWRHYPEGYRLDVEERWRWKGRCGGGSHWRLPRPPLTPSSAKRLQHLLDCHNVTRAEWGLFCAIDGHMRKVPGCLVRSAPRLAEKAPGPPLSSADVQRGLETCLANGWLRTVDEAVRQEVLLLLRDDPALAPLSKATSSLGELDFTSTGARLYQMISAECFGVNWDSAVTVEQTRYREEHRYCASEEGIRAALAWYAQQGENVLRSRIIPIGPWCVRWWERFPAGYRLEVEIGEPISPSLPASPAAPSATRRRGRQ
jgi:hypothetical protein